MIRDWPPITYIRYCREPYKTSREFLPRASSRDHRIISKGWVYQRAVVGPIVYVELETFTIRGVRRLISRVELHEQGIGYALALHLQIIEMRPGNGAAVLYRL